MELTIEQAEFLASHPPTRPEPKEPKGAKMLERCRAYAAHIGRPEDVREIFARTLQGDNATCAKVLAFCYPDAWTAAEKMEVEQARSDRAVAEQTERRALAAMLLPGLQKITGLLQQLKAQAAAAPRQFPPGAVLRSLDGRARIKAALANDVQKATWILEPQTVKGSNHENSR
jgi:hypothetical protein